MSVGSAARPPSSRAYAAWVRRVSPEGMPFLNNGQKDRKCEWLFDCTSVQKNCASKEGAALQRLQLLRLHGSALRRPIALSLAARLSLTLTPLLKSIHFSSIHPQRAYGRNIHKKSLFGIRRALIGSQPSDRALIGSVALQPTAQLDARSVALHFNH